MPKLSPYLTFNNNCREAMNFYKECLGGNLSLQTVGESPLSETMPSKMKDSILHATLNNGELVLMGSDMVSDSRLTKGNAVSLMLDCNNEEEIETIYEKLSAGGKKDCPIQDTFWGAKFGALTDKFGNPWLLNYTKATN